MRTTILLSLLVILSGTAMADNRTLKAFNKYDALSNKFQGTYFASIFETRRNMYRDQLISHIEGYADTGWIDDEIKNAWAKGYTGQNVKVNVIDNFRERPAHIETRRRGSTSHGGRVSAIIGGGKQFNQEHTGIAPGTIVRNYNVWDSASWDERLDADIVTFTSTFGLTRDLSYTDDNIPVNDDALIVVVAGNYGSTCTEGTWAKKHCSKLATALFNSENSDNFLMVGNFNPYTNKIHRTSGKAGELADNFVVEVGATQFNFESVDSPYGNYSTDHKTFNGTSYAVPKVAAKAALIKSKFPDMTPADLVDVITSTADDLGAPGVDPIYGHGRINLTRALSPVGTLR